ncbi:MAG: cation-translocating P-type ATPase [Candidatus Nanoarchaeia archaeon]
MAATDEFYKLDKEKVLELFKTTNKGLADSEAQKRLEKYGLNKIEIKQFTNPGIIFLKQFKSLLVALLIFATFFSFLIGEKLDALVIGAIILLNAVLGFVQEYRAEKSVQALIALSTPFATVIRDGRQKQIKADQIVPGDILVLNIGTKIAADCRLLEAYDLKVDESLLTGESVPVLKHTNTISASVPVADRKNCVFANTLVIHGKGLGIVISTGKNTEVGKIAQLLASEKPKPTPLQLKLSSIAKTLSLFVVLIALLIFSLGVIQGKNLFENVLMAIALAVAAVPEGLPAVVTIALSLGVSRMSKVNAIIRELPAVETLGSCTFIATDKTGTLTKNEMTVQKIYINDLLIDVTGRGYEPKGEFLLNNKPIDLKDDVSANLLFKISALCNNAELYQNKGWQIVGDPTEGALLVLAAKSGFWKEKLAKEFPEVRELSFDSNRKRMSTIHKFKNQYLVLTKGAPDILLKCCKWYLKDGKLLVLTPKLRKTILKINENLAKSALRVLGFAYKSIDKLPDSTNPDDIERDLVWIGLAGMADPLRPEAAEAVQIAREAGIRVAMVTGDHVETAKAIANQLGLLDKDSIILESTEFDSLTKKQFEEIVEKVTVYARVTPEQKVRIVKALQTKGHVVAMTGDGVNDAPALKAADIGIAMGLKGTDVAKEASAMILQDDNFATIVSAIKEGRTIYANIRKFLKYLLSSNFAEVAVIFLASLLFLPLPVLALQLLWINLITDGLPAIALGVDPATREIMKIKPRKKEEKPINKIMLKEILFVSSIITIGTLFIFWLNLHKDINYARSAVFTAIVLFEMFNVYNIRSERSAFVAPKNIWLHLAVISSIILQLIVVYAPPLQLIFGTTALSLDTLAIILGVCSLVLILTELWKILKFKDIRLFFYKAKNL